MKWEPRTSFLIVFFLVNEFYSKYTMTSRDVTSITVLKGLKLVSAFMYVSLYVLA